MKAFSTLLMPALSGLSHVAIAQTQKGADIEGEAAFDWSGFSVSIPDAQTVAIWAPGNDGSGTNAGYVRVYGFSITGVTGNSSGRQCSLYPNPTNGPLSFDPG